MAHSEERIIQVDLAQQKLVGRRGGIYILVFTTKHGLFNQYPRIPEKRIPEEEHKD